MKLRKQDRIRLESILNDLERVQKFILADSFQYVRPISRATTTIDLEDKQGHAFTCPMEKRIGTDLCYLYNATDKLRSALADITVESE